MTTARSMRSVLVVSMVAFLACKEDSSKDIGAADGGSGGSDAPATAGSNATAHNDEGSIGETQIPRKTPANELDATQAADVCNTVQAMLDQAENASAQCTADAVLEADDVESCEHWRDGCIAERASRDPHADERDGCDGDAIAAAFANCSGEFTVGDIEACFLEVAAFGSDLTCADVGKVEPPACARALAQWCPEGFDDQTRDDASDMSQSEPTSMQDSNDMAPSDCPTGGDSDAVDCSALCTPLIASGCNDAPSERECFDVCGAARGNCPAVIRELTDCVTGHGGAWQCNPRGEPYVPGCEDKLACFEPCLDGVLARSGP